MLPLVPFTPTIVGSHPTTGRSLQVSVYGNLAYLADGAGGFFAADNGVGRILHFDPDGKRPSIRHTDGFWRNEARKANR